MADQPMYAVADSHLIPVLDYPHHLTPIPTSKMFVIRQALQTYRDKHGADAVVYDASQGDGGKSLDGVPGDILERAYQLQREVGTGYDTPAGHPRFREAVVEDYWHLDSASGWGTANVLAAQGGRDALMKAYSAMIYCGYERVGDALITSAVPWISYNWGPYAGGLNVLRAAGDPAKAWAYEEAALEETVALASKSDRKVAGLILTSPDNPTGRTLPLERQIALAQKALSLDVGFVLFDWIYHWVTEGEPHDVNQVLQAFTPQDRERLMFLDGLTKSLGGSNIRNVHLLAAERVVKFITSHASHGVIPSFYSQAVAIAAYEMGYARASEVIVGPTNASRRLLRAFLEEKGYEFIMGDGYYAFINIQKWIRAAGYEDSQAMGQTLAEDFGVAIVPGMFFAPVAKDWIRFSYALPPERTMAAISRLDEALRSFE
ncbi:MAG: pyridoxal phosphate-dependent aminotransferase [Chloroflexi bacterium]|nr:pyridoxal phosphate-dependent aminotransferase [Chloroflexota bacterium]